MFFLEARCALKRARAHAECFGGHDFVFAEAKRHQQVAALAGGDVGRKLQQRFTDFRADHERMYGGTEVERFPCSVLDGLERRFGEPKLGKPRKVHARRALQGAAAFHVQRQCGDRVVIVAKLYQRHARIGAEQAAEAAVVARAVRRDTSIRRQPRRIDAQAARTAPVERERHRRGVAARMRPTGSKLPVQFARTRGGLRERAVARERRARFARQLQCFVFAALRAAPVRERAFLFCDGGGFHEQRRLRERGDGSRGGAAFVAVVGEARAHQQRGEAFEPEHDRPPSRRALGPMPRI